MFPWLTSSWRSSVELLQELVNQGNTVLVIEHNLDVVKSVDYVIDLGPDGGNKGGQLVAVGTPEQILKSKTSETAKFLKGVFPPLLSRFATLTMRPFKNGRTINR